MATEPEHQHRSDRISFKQKHNNEWFEVRRCLDCNELYETPADSAPAVNPKAYQGAYTASWMGPLCESLDSTAAARARRPAQGRVVQIRR